MTRQDRLILFSFLFLDRYVQTRVRYGLDSSMDWIELDWIGSNSGRNCMDLIGLGRMTANCLESETFRRGLKAGLVK